MDKTDQQLLAPSANPVTFVSGDMPCLRAALGQGLFHSTIYGIEQPKISTDAASSDFRRLLPTYLTVVGEQVSAIAYLCLALFTLIAAGGFIAIGDWIRAYQGQLIDLFEVERERLPSYSTIRRMLLNLDYRVYSECLAKFFGIEPKSGETIAVDGKVLRGSYQLETDNPNSESHPAIMLVSAYGGARFDSGTL